MADDVVKMFVDEYRSVAEQVGKQIGVSPSVLLSQWAMETDYGRKVPGHFNLGNIKDFSGTGTQARDRQTKSVDKYLNFESPEAFGDYYAHMMKRLYPNALNAGSDVSKYTQGLMGGERRYAETSPDQYEQAIKNFQGNVSAFYKEPKETEAQRILREKQESGETTTTAPEAPQDVISPETGALLGAASSSVGQIPFTPEVPQRVDLAGAQTKADIAQSKAELAEQRLQERTGQYEAARQAQVEAEARMAPRMPPGVPAAPAGVPTGAPVAGAPEGAPVVELGAPGRYGKATGPGSMVYNYARVAGVPEIEAGRALGMGKGEGEVYDLLERKRRGIREAQTRFPSEGWQENPLYGGLMTRDVAPKASYVAGAEGLRSVPVQEAVPAALSHEQELARIQAEQAAAQQQMAEAQEMERIKNEAALAKRGATRAQAVADARKTRAEESQIDLRAAQKAAPGPVEQVLRPAEVTGAKAGQTGFFRRGIMGGIAGAYGAMSANELLDRYNKGDRDPELLKALAATISAGAAVLPAVGPKTARLKGAGLMAAVPLMGYDLYRAIQDEEKRLRMEEELRSRVQQAKGFVAP